MVLSVVVSGCSWDRDGRKLVYIYMFSVVVVMVVHGCNCDHGCGARMGTG